MRYLIIGDVHGCFRELTELLKKMNFDLASDHLIFLGDLIDRGKGIYETVELIQNLQRQMGNRCVCIRGNHEQMLIDAVYADNPESSDHRFWMANHGQDTLNAFKRRRDRLIRHLDWFESMPVWYETKDFICVHAGLLAEKETENDPQILLWTRGLLESPDYFKYNGKLAITGHTPCREVLYLKNGWKHELKGTCGPASAPQPLYKTGCLCIDTACVFGQKLTGMAIEKHAATGQLEYSLYQVKKRILG